MWRGDGHVSLAGEFDASNQALVREVVGAAVGHGWDRLIFECSGVEFADAASVRCFIEAAELGIHVVIRDPSPPLARVIDIAALTDHPYIEVETNP